MVEDYPEEGGDAQGCDRVFGSGGGRLNAAVAFRALDVPVSLVGCVGTDSLADVALSVARERGVDEQWVVRDSREPMGTCFIVVSGVERTLFSHRPANACLDEEAARKVRIEADDLVLFFGYAFMIYPQRDAALAQLARAKRAGCTTVIDVGLAVACDRVDLDRLGEFDLILTNEVELLALADKSSFGLALEKLHSRGVSNVVVKRGGRECFVRVGTDRHEFAGLGVEAIDRTGCGDAFAVAFSWLFSQCEPISKCAETAN